MAVYFLDASAVVERYVQETGTAWVRALAAPATGHFLFIARITDTHILRAYDAVQLAASLEIWSQDPSLALVSADRDLNAAAISEGRSVEDPNAHP